MGTEIETLVMSASTVTISVRKIQLEYLQQIAGSSQSSVYQKAYLNPDADCACLLAYTREGVLHPSLGVSTVR